MTKHPDLFAALAAPFDPHEVKVRSTAGRQLHYITARIVMNRLDNVLGPENWHDDFVPGENSVLCRLTIRPPDGSTHTKSDAGGFAGMSDAGDDDKSGYSDAFKRAAVKFGVARYLYRDGVPTFVQEHAAPAAADRRDDPPPAATPALVPAQPRPPRSGKALFAWTKDREQEYQVGLLKYLNQWAKLQDFPGRMIDWNTDQVSHAYQEATRKLQARESQEQEVAP